MNAIKKYLTEKNISPEKFVEIINSRYPKAGITNSAMYKWVAGERNPRPKRAYWISKATNNEIKFISKSLK